MTAIEINKGADKVEGTQSPLESAQEVTFADEAVTFSAKATYGQGAIKTTTSMNHHLMAALKLVLLIAKITLLSKRQTFAGTGAGSLPELNSANVRKFTARGLGLDKNSKFDVLVDVGQQHIVIAYPASIGNITQIRYEEGNDNNMAANFQKQ